MFKYSVTDCKVVFSYKAWDNIDYSCFNEISFPRSLDVQYTDVEEKPARVQILDLNTNLIISQWNFVKRLWENVVWSMLKSKIEIALEFFLTFTLFSILKSQRQIWDILQGVNSKERV